MTTPDAWMVHGLARSGALVMSLSAGKPAYGGTPSDDTVVRKSISTIVAALCRDWNRVIACWGKRVPIPPFDMRGLLPPFLGDPAARGDRSPYWATMPEFAAALGTTPQRKELLLNLIAYRALLAAEGYTGGIQFIDGSFVENVESTRNRPPSDIDLYSILNVPQKYLSDQFAWTSSGFPFWEKEIFHRQKNKERFKLDTFAVLFEELAPQPMLLIGDIIYWYGLFSHQRDTFAWKGFVGLPLDPSGDKAAIAALGSA